MAFWSPQIPDSAIPPVKSDVTGGQSVGTPDFIADVNGVEFIWPGNLLSVVWTNSLLLVGSIVDITSRSPIARIRVSVTVTVGGQVTLTRSSGTVIDEPGSAVLEIP